MSVFFGEIKMDKIKRLEQLIKEQNRNIKLLEEAVLWIHEPARVRLGLLNKISNKQFNNAFPDNDEEH